MEEAVQTAVPFQYRRSQLVIVLCQRLLQIQQGDDRLRPSGRFDLRMNCLELTRVTANQNDVSSMASTGQCDRATDTAARTGDGDNAAFELIRACDVFL